MDGLLSLEENNSPWLGRFCEAETECGLFKTNRETNGACVGSISRSWSAAARAPRPPLRLIELDAPFGKILRRPRMEGNRRGGGLLVLQPEIFRLLVHGDHVVAF